MVAVEIPGALARIAARQAGLLELAQCFDAGLTRRQVDRLVAQGAWRRPTRGVYDTRAGADRRASDRASPDRMGSDRTWDERRERAAWLGLLAFGPEAIAVGTSALALLGVRGLPECITPEVALPRATDRRNRDAVRLREFDHGMTTVPRYGRRTASAEWALAQAVPELDRRHGLAVLDSALHLGLIDRARLVRSHDLARGRRGVASRHELWTLADARAESPLESFGRLDCIDAGVPPDALQMLITDRDGRIIARADMAWRLGGGRWLAVEMDGREVHVGPVFADRRRQNAIAATGRVDLLRFTGRDLPGGVGREVAAFLRAHRRA